MWVLLLSARTTTLTWALRRGKGVKKTKKRRGKREEGDKAGREAKSLLQNEGTELNHPKTRTIVSKELKFWPNLESLSWKYCCDDLVQIFQKHGEETDAQSRAGTCPKSLVG